MPPPMTKLLLISAVAALCVVGHAWGQDDPSTKAVGATAAATPSKDSKKEAEKRPKPKPTKKPRKPAPRSGNP